MLFEPIWHSLKNLNTQIDDEEEQEVQVALFIGSLPALLILGILAAIAKLIDMIILGIVALIFNVFIFLVFIPVSPMRHTPLVFHYYVLDMLFMFSRLWRRKELRQRSIKFPRPEYTGVASMNTAMFRTALLTYSFRNSNGSKLCVPLVLFLTIWLTVLRIIDCVVSMIVVLLVMTIFMLFTLSAIVSACTDVPLKMSRAILISLKTFLKQYWDTSSCVGKLYESMTLTIECSGLTLSQSKRPLSDLDNDKNDLSLDENPAADNQVAQPSENPPAGIPAGIPIAIEKLNNDIDANQPAAPLPGYGGQAEL